MSVRQDSQYPRGSWSDFANEVQEVHVYAKKGGSEEQQQQVIKKEQEGKRRDSQRQRQRRGRDYCAIAPN